MGIGNVMTDLRKPEPLARVRRRKRRQETVVKVAVRAEVAERDGYCRLAGGPFGPCRGPSSWAHLEDFRRFKTRGQAAESRHTTTGSLMLCGSGTDGHHGAYDRHDIAIEERTARGADGPLRFTAGDVTYEEPDDDD